MALESAPGGALFIYRNSVLPAAGFEPGLM
jgi:hypothetical protein